MGRDSADAEDEESIALHPGFRHSESVVLHRFGNAPGYADWRRERFRSMQPKVAPDREPAREIPPALMGPLVISLPPSFQFTSPSLIAQDLEDESIPARNADAEIRLAQSRRLRVDAILCGKCTLPAISLARHQRNAPPLFGSGLIDGIPESDIVAGSLMAFPGFREIRGRVSRLADGSIGRFGWKAQTSTLREFVLTACSVELGLEVPDHPQAGDPLKPEARARGLDLGSPECDLLVAFVATLPAPERQVPASADLARKLRTGEAIFESIGCATCHTPGLGNVRGIYSDLLLHDMGPDGSDSGSYGTFRPRPPTSPDSPGSDPLVSAGSRRRVPDSEATGREWRTPPLWGLRDSGPYLHDGRADTLDQAIALHGGQGMEPAARYFRLSPSDQQKVRAFLKSLVAPTGLR